MKLTKFPQVLKAEICLRGGRLNYCRKDSFTFERLDEQTINLTNILLPMSPKNKILEQIEDLQSPSHY